MINTSRVVSVIATNTGVGRVIEAEYVNKEIFELTAQSLGVPLGAILCEQGKVPTAIRGYTLRCLLNFEDISICAY